MNPILTRTALALLLVAPATAQVVPIGPFSGDQAEGFESHVPGAAAYCLATRVFGGAGELCTPGTSGATVVTGWDFFCSLEPFSGSQFFGSSIGMSVFRFGNAVDRFGGYFASNGEKGDVHLRFLTGTGQVIDDVAIDVSNDCEWTWHGFETLGAGIRRVEVVNSASGGGFVMMDNMHIESAALGERYCEAGVNSTGRSAHISAFGSVSISSNDLLLTTADQPSATPGLFYFGGTSGYFVFGDGFGCVRSDGSGLQRLPLASSNAIGVMRTTVDYESIPGPSLQILAGSTWYFQAIYRDPSAGGTGFNLSDALALAFVP